MLKLNRATTRRKAGLTAALLMAGGLTGAAVLAVPGTAFAGPMQEATTTAITGTQQSAGSGGATLAVSVSVTTPTGAPLAPAGYVQVSDGSASCRAYLAVPWSGLKSTGSCDFNGLHPGNYDLSATYYPSSMQFGPSKVSSYWVRVNGGHPRSSLSTWLNCPQRVTNGKSGTCTLYVTDHGWATSSWVSASISLPGALQARSCKQGQNWWNCSISHNTATANLGTLSPGQTKSLSVTFTGHLPGWGWQRSHPERVTVHGSAQAIGGYASSRATVTVFPRYYW
jgi:hypothetical protein